MKKFDYIGWVTKNKHGLLNEQRDDLEKNKLRPIKPEEPPRPLSTPNSHHRFRIKYCTPHPTHGVGYEYTYHLYHPSNPYHHGGLQCNGQMCQPGDAGKTYTGTFGPNLTPFLAGHEYELLWFDMPVNKNVFINLTYQNDMCPGTCDTFNNWPLSYTQGYNEFMQQYGATIAGGTPVNSQWSLGGAGTNYPSQSSFCEWCEWSNDPVWTTPDTSPIGTSNWLIGQNSMCNCCPNIP